MFVLKLYLSIFLIFFHVCNGTRRIQDGLKLSTGVEKPYVVYLIRAPITKAKYDYWTCGGALVTSVFVVTSAACIDDVNYLYVIAGYNIYVTDSEVETDPCTSQKKKRVIFSCCPAGYDVKYDQLERWSLIDIGVVKVESPYDFTDESFKTLCSYIPTTIPINYEAKYQEPGTDALVFGWGHLNQWRKESDKNNYNQRDLKYAPVLIMDKEKCKKHYEVYNNMSEVIERHMICSLDKGNINDQGIQIIRTTPPTPLLLNCRGEESCDEEDRSYDMYNSRKHIRDSNSTFNETWSDIENYTTPAYDKQTEKLDMKSFKNARRYGICQNDHGGPLVTYVGSHEVLIGVASVFKVAEDSTCIGPFLYTSTQCNGAFLDCVMKFTGWPIEKNRTSRRTMCKTKSGGTGHATIHRHISWANHPAGPSDEEKNEIYGRGSNQKLPEKHTIGDPPIFNEGYRANKMYTVSGRGVGDLGRYPRYEESKVTSKYIPNIMNTAYYPKHAANYRYKATKMNLPPPPPPPPIKNNRMVMRPQIPLRS